MRRDGVMVLPQEFDVSGEGTDWLFSSSKFSAWVVIPRVFTPKALHISAQGRGDWPRTLGDESNTRPYPERVTHCGSARLFNPFGVTNTKVDRNPGCARLARDPGLICVTPSA